MSITIPMLGWLAIPIGLYLFGMSAAWLYRLAVFFVPFSATGVIVFTGAHVALPITISMYFGSLWIARTGINALVRSRAWEAKKWTHGELLILAFIGVCYLSMLIPIFMAGQIFVFELDSRSLVPLTFGGNQIIYLAHLTYGLTFSLLMARYNENPTQIIATIKILMLGLLFTALWGFMEAFSYYAGINFPYFIFNNTPADAEIAYNFVRRVHWEIGLLRMSSVADEPSVLAQTLLVGVIMLLVFVAYGYKLFGRVRDIVLLLILLAALLLSGSSSGIVGLAVAFVVFIFLIANIKSHNISPYWIVLSLVLGACLAWANVDAVNIFVDQLLLNKLDTGSGQERLLTVSMGWRAFLDSPIIGVGWGSITSMDLVVRLLSNVGLVGAFVFFAFMLSTIHKLWRYTKYDFSSNYFLVVVSAANLLAFISYWAVISVAGWATQFQISYIVIGIALAASGLARTLQPPFWPRALNSPNHAAFQSYG